MKREISIHGLSGEGKFEERTIAGIAFYKRIRRQKWSPAVHEIEVECGVRVGRFRLGLTSSKRYWLDKNEIEYRRLWL